VKPLWVSPQAKQLGVSPLVKQLGVSPLVKQLGARPWLLSAFPQFHPGPAATRSTACFLSTW